MDKTDENGNPSDEPRNGQDLNASVVESSDKADNSCHSPVESPNISDCSIVEAEVITEERVAELMAEIKKYHYSPGCVKDNLGLQGELIHLFNKDYNVETVDNGTGQLSFNYPQELLIPVGRKSSDNNTTPMEFKKELYVKQVEATSTARSRSRFVVPVILCYNKFICRSGTVGNWITTAYETVVKNEAPRTQLAEESYLQKAARKISEIVRSSISLKNTICDVAKITTMAKEMRSRMLCDAELLQNLKVEHICDLMVENEKVFLQVLSVSSSEKVHKDIYKNSKIEQMPFPGCEFFTDYHNASRKPEGLIFNWDLPDVNVTFELSEDAAVSFPDIDWKNFKKWDLIQLTKSYMKVLLTFLARDTGGLVVHCISGWDRTPVFISLLRVSLWADGVVHESLDTTQMAYLTLAYDWYLFGHNFPVRLARKEEIMHFCLNFMQHMASDDFSITRIFHELPPEQKQNREFPAFKPNERFNKMTEIGLLLLRVYEDEVLNKPAEQVDEKPASPFENVEFSG